MRPWPRSPTPTGTAPNPAAQSIQYLEARHRAHARVEDRIRCGKNTGFGRFPSRVFAINQAWLHLALTGIDLIAWTQTLLLHGDLARTEPKKLRYRLLHVAARLTRTARRTRRAIPADWSWTDALTRAFNRIAALPQPRRLTPKSHASTRSTEKPGPAPGHQHASEPADQPRTNSSTSSYDRSPR